MLIFVKMHKIYLLSFSANYAHNEDSPTEPLLCRGCFTLLTHCQFGGIIISITCCGNLAALRLPLSRLAYRPLGFGLVRLDQLFQYVLRSDPRRVRVVEPEIQLFLHSGRLLCSCSIVCPSIPKYSISNLLSA